MRSVKPGSLYTAEQQCRLFLGEEAVACSYSSVNATVYFTVTVHTFSFIIFFIECCVFNTL